MTSFSPELNHLGGDVASGCLYPAESNPLIHKGDGDRLTLHPWLALHDEVMTSFTYELNHLGGDVASSSPSPAELNPLAHKVPV